MTEKVIEITTKEISVLFTSVFPFCTYLIYKKEEVLIYFATNSWNVLKIKNIACAIFYRNSIITF